MINTRRAHAASAPVNWCKQRGVAAVEFALIASFLFTLLFGIMEFGRILFYWNTTAEATRLGARLAAVCGKNAPGIETEMGKMLNILTPGNINIDYRDSTGEINASCSATCASPLCTGDVLCQSVTVSITGMNVPTFIPFLPLNMIIPPFTTTLPREIMDSTGKSECT